MATPEQRADFEYTNDHGFHRAHISKTRGALLRELWELKRRHEELKEYVSDDRTTERNLRSLRGSSRV